MKPKFNITQRREIYSEILNNLLEHLKHSSAEYSLCFPLEEKLENGMNIICLNSEIAKIEFPEFYLFMDDKKYGEWRFKTNQDRIFVLTIVIEMTKR